VFANGRPVDRFVTAQFGFPLTPQLRYSPSDTGGARNPVRVHAARWDKSDRSFGHGGRDHQHLDDGAPSAVRAELALVTRY
jgi:hypothetical protein